MKRSRNSYETEDIKHSISDINTDFINECHNEFYEDPANIIARNSVVAIGSMISTTDSTKLNNIDHVFLNSIKRKNVKSTNQGQSGRCWMYSGLNLFRHSVISALDLENFEFSETYLFFWDKLERSNSYLRWFLDHPNVSPMDRSFTCMVDDYTSDGGYWNTFANLVTKYGLVPKSAMKETFQSDCSDDMNKIINDRLQACANYLITHKNEDPEELIDIKDETVKQIYNILVKFLGEPPKRFNWSYTNEENISNIIGNLSPLEFTNLVMPDVDLNDFVTLFNVPGNTIHNKIKYNKLYEIKYTNNIYEGNQCQLLNLPINELSKYAMKSILSGMPVWFGADVSKDFNPYHATLDDELSNEDIVFGDSHKFDKGQRIIFRNLQANHAMTLTGVNIGSDGVPVSWQVENSWGYWDNETPGEDGFLYMSHSWFKKNVIEIVVHKNYLSRSVKKLLKQTPIFLEPWDCVAPALRISPRDRPSVFDTISKIKNKTLK